MTPADDPQPLQFDTAIPQVEGTTGALAGPPDLVCRTCQRTIPDEYFDVNGEPVCESCRAAIVRHGEPLRGAAPLLRAGLFGVVAAVAGAVLYYAVIAITGLEIGLVAIAIGYMVGYAIQRGTGGRGGRTFQVMAVILAYWSVGLAYVPVVIKAMAAQNATQAPSPQSPVAGTADVVSLPLLATYVLAFSFALPLLVVFGSLPGGLISAAIIAFGMHQAWRMTASPQFTIAGPFRVGTREQTAT